MSDEAKECVIETRAPQFLPVVDRTRQIAPCYSTPVFFRDKSRTAHVPLYKWVWYSVLEIFFGEELLENLVITVSRSGSPFAPDLEGEYGCPLPLSLHIPSGIFTNLFRKHLVELLYYKYYHQYLLLDPVPAAIYADDNGAKWDVTQIRFRMKKNLLYQVIAFRRVYLLEALVLNIVIDASVYAVTQSVEAIPYTAFIVEAFRRLMKL